MGFLRMVDTLGNAYHLAFLDYRIVLVRWSWAVVVFVRLSNCSRPSSAVVAVAIVEGFDIARFVA